MAGVALKPFSVAGVQGARALLITDTLWARVSVRSQPSASAPRPANASSVTSHVCHRGRGRIKGPQRSRVYTWSPSLSEDWGPAAFSSGPSREPLPDPSSELQASRPPGGYPCGRRARKCSQVTAGRCRTPVPLPPGARGHRFLNVQSYVFHFTSRMRPYTI